MNDIRLYTHQRDEERNIAPYPQPDHHYHHPLLYAAVILTITTNNNRMSSDQHYAIPVLKNAIILSLITASTATVLAVIIGTPLAYLNARIPYPGRNLVETLMDIPIVLSPSVAGLALLVLLGRPVLLGSWMNEHGITIIFTIFTVIIAQLFVAGPLHIRQAKSAFAMMDPVYEDAARTLGETPLKAFLKVTIPLAKTGLISGIILSFARALVIQPHLLLLDEPLTALDQRSREKIRLELRTHLVRSNRPTILVTHSRKDARILGDRVMILN